MIEVADKTPTNPEGRVRTDPAMCERFRAAMNEGRCVPSRLNPSTIFYETGPIYGIFSCQPSRKEFGDAMRLPSNPSSVYIGHEPSLCGVALVGEKGAVVPEPLITRARHAVTAL